jgi:hypothetical protein
LLHFSLVFIDDFEVEPSFVRCQLAVPEESVSTR